jgi:hypothetical protein
MTRFRQTRSIALLAASAALCLVIALEIFGWRQSAPSQGPTAGAIAGHGAPDDAARSAGRRDAWLQESLARPLFSFNRRPVEVGMRGLPRLTGIVLAGSYRIAIFAGPSDEHPIIAQAGGHVGAYEVHAITEAGVTVAGPEGTTLIKPVFDVGRASASTLPAASLQPARTVAK